MSSHLESRPRHLTQRLVVTQMQCFLYDGNAYFATQNYVEMSIWLRLNVEVLSHDFKHSACKAILLNVKFLKKNKETLTEESLMMNCWKRTSKADRFPLGATMTAGEKAASHGCEGENPVVDSVVVLMVLLHWSDTWGISEPISLLKWKLSTMGYDTCLKYLLWWRQISQQMLLPGTYVSWLLGSILWHIYGRYGSDGPSSCLEGYWQDHSHQWESACLISQCVPKTAWVQIYFSIVSSFFQSQVICQNQGQVLSVRFLPQSIVF